MTSGLMQGKRGLVMGVANDHSIAWGIAKALSAEGAELAFTYQGEALGKRVTPLADSLGSTLVAPCDVEDLASVDAVFARIAEEWGAIDFLVHCIGFSDRNELKGRYADTTRENFVRTMVISAFSFTELAKRAAVLMPSGGAMLTLTFGGSTRVMPNYNVMGVAKAALEVERALSRRRLRPGQYPRQRHFGGTHSHARRRRIADARFMFNFQRAHSPLRRTVTIENVGGVGALSALEPVGRRDRRGSFRRRRLQHHLHAEAGRHQGVAARNSAARDRRHPVPFRAVICGILKR